MDDKGKTYKTFKTSFQLGSDKGKPCTSYYTDYIVTKRYLTAGPDPPFPPPEPAEVIPKQHNPMVECTTHKRDFINYGNDTLLNLATSRQDSMKAVKCAHTRDSVVIARKDYDPRHRHAATMTTNKWYFRDRDGFRPTEQDTLQGNISPPTHHRYHRPSTIIRPRPGLRMNLPALTRDRVWDVMRMVKSPERRNVTESKSAYRWRESSTKPPAGILRYSKELKK
ncbi:uncharacterized protein LOC100369291 [Saccoglossus kowalevskii]|uniref:Uncharacterized protein LOC100369291 n=1 Tax=Saccoglossus kowalevskii TaxID=10224 RepID=A0ABM0GZL0_SACKO|nr:PREDICTED: uncharacterized protein LOC100369291 [Saccoglossus kowalevskii]